MNLESLGFGLVNFLCHTILSREKSDPKSTLAPHSFHTAEPPQC